MPWPESWPIRGEDVACADSAAATKEAASGHLHICGGGQAAEGTLYGRCGVSKCKTTTPYWPRLGPWHIGYVS